VCLSAPITAAFNATQGRPTTLLTGWGGLHQRRARRSSAPADFADRGPQLPLAEPAGQPRQGETIGPTAGGAQEPIPERAPLSKAGTGAENSSGQLPSGALPRPKTALSTTELRSASTEKAGRLLSTSPWIETDPGITSLRPRPRSQRTNRALGPDVRRGTRAGRLVALAAKPHPIASRKERPCAHLLSCYNAAPEQWPAAGG